MLNKLGAEARVARFIVDLSERFADLGYSSKLFSLRMTRNEIGAYLGLTLETVSRTFSTFMELGYIDIHMRDIQINDITALKNLRTVLRTGNHKKPVSLGVVNTSVATTLHSIQHVMPELQM